MYVCLTMVHRLCLIVTLFENHVKGNENELSIILVKIGSVQDTATEEESFKVYKKYQGTST